jgi:hypothetical protein
MAEQLGAQERRGNEMLPAVVKLEVPDIPRELTAREKVEKAQQETAIFEAAQVMGEMSLRPSTKLAETTEALSATLEHIANQKLNWQSSGAIKPKARKKGRRQKLKGPRHVYDPSWTGIPGSMFADEKLLDIGEIGGASPPAGETSNDTARAKPKTNRFLHPKPIIARSLKQQQRVGQGVMQQSGGKASSTAAPTAPLASSLAAPSATVFMQTPPHQTPLPPQRMGKSPLERKGGGGGGGGRGGRGLRRPKKQDMTQEMKQEMKKQGGVQHPATDPASVSGSSGGGVGGGAGAGQSADTATVDTSTGATSASTGNTTEDTTEDTSHSRTSPSSIPTTSNTSSSTSPAASPTASPAASRTSPHASPKRSPHSSTHNTASRKRFVGGGGRKAVGGGDGSEQEEEADSLRVQVQALQQQLEERDWELQQRRIEQAKLEQVTVHTADSA